MTTYVTLEAYLQGKASLTTIQALPKPNGHRFSPAENMDALLVQINKYLTELLGGTLPVIPLKVNCGYRTPEEKPKNGSATSWHYYCGAIDLDDDERGTFWNIVAKRIDLLAKYNLYIEDPRWTPGWLHFQIYAPGSGKRIFIPSTTPALRPNLVPPVPKV